MDFVTLELRPRLQSCNVFICIKETTDNEKVRVNLNEQCIDLNVNLQKYTFQLPLVRIIPSSLSALNVNSNWIHFRVQTKPFNSAFGSFTTEVMNNTSMKANDINTAKRNEMLLKNTGCLISCTYCTNIVSKVVCFERVLPLPSADCDPSEWFCCKHNDNGDKDHFPSLLCPQETDCFYTPLFKVIHKNVLENNVLIDENAIVCERCLHKLGLTHTTGSFKLWNCCVNYTSPRDSKLVFRTTNPTEDFILAFKTTVNCIFGEVVALESTVGDEKHYLLIKPMDWHLDLFVEPKVILATDVNNLKQIRVVKVLYKYRTAMTMKKEDIADANSCEVAFSVIVAALDYLVLSTKRLPHLYRVADDYYIGYINLQDCTT